MLRLVCFIILVSVVSMELFLQSKLTSHWENFKVKHMKSYTAGEENVKKENFKYNVELILEHNLKADLGEYKYRLAVNQYSDMGPEEFRKSKMGLRIPARLNNTRFSSRPNKVFGNAPSSVDWRDSGIVSPIKNQGDCGSCWSFAVAGALEGAWAKKNNKLEVLSEQNLVDCASQGAGYSNMGCEGGFPNDAFKYVIDNGGIDLDSCYPYETRQNEECRYEENCRGATMTGYEQITPGDEEQLKSALAENGPVALGLDATNFQSYSSGIFSDESCQQQGNHAVLVVGYGAEEGGDYWIIKNSWGPEWGEEGYIRLARNAENMCGVTNMASYPVV